MTAAELIEELKTYPQNAIVMTEGWEATDKPEERLEYYEFKNEHKLRGKTKCW